VFDGDARATTRIRTGSALAQEMKGSRHASHAIVIARITPRGVSAGTVVFKSFTLFRTFPSLLDEKLVPPRVHNVRLTDAVNI
jgi:hypothetical protein